MGFRQFFIWLLCLTVWQGFMWAEITSINSLIGDIFEITDGILRITNGLDVNIKGILQLLEKILENQL